MRATSPNAQGFVLARAVHDEGKDTQNATKRVRANPRVKESVLVCSCDRWRISTSPTVGNQGKSGAVMAGIRE